MIILVLVLYLLVLLVLAYWSRQETHSIEGYYVAGKKLPYWVVAFSTNATGESGWLLLGLTGMGYLVGPHALWIALGEVIGVGLSWLFVAYRLKVSTDRYDSVTVPDYLASRFTDARHLLRLLSVIIILTMVCVYTAAQMVAAGKAFDAFLETGYAYGVMLGALITLVYTAVGGYKAVAYTDVVQGVLMLFALITIPVVGLYAVGGPAEMISALGEIDPTLVNPFGEHGWSIAGVIAVASFLAVGLPFLGVPQLMVRFISIRDRKEIPKAGVISVLCILAFDVGAVFIGMTGRILFPDLPDAETIMPVMSAELFHPLLTGIFIVVVLAAIMSTVDSLLILASSAVVRDVMQKVFHPRLTSEALSGYGKWVTVIIGLGAMLFALTEARVIFSLVLFAWSGLGAAFAPVLLCALFWERTTLAGAFAGMSAGFVTTIVWILFFKENAYGLYEMIPGFIAGLLMTILVSLASGFFSIKPGLKTDRAEN